MLASRLSRDSALTFFSNLFFLWVILQYALGGWQLGWFLLTVIGPPAWFALGIVGALVLYKSDYRTDLPLFIAGYALGYWGEWWGTTRGVWTYANGQMPPDYLPPLWAIGLLTVYHLHLLVGPRWPARLHIPRSMKVSSLVLLPLLAFLISLPRLLSVDWAGRLDAHFYAGLVVGALLLLWRFDVDETFGLYLSGMLLGGTYEWLGTWMHEWTYVTHEIPPLWIIPLWGIACVAMVKLSRLLTLGVSRTWRLDLST